MLMPKYTIRRLLLITAVSGVFFAIVAAAARGNHWAIALSAAITSLFVMLLFHAIVYVVAWWISATYDASRPQRKPTSPFANAAMPPQLVKPQDPE